VPLANETIAILGTGQVGRALHAALAHSNGVRAALLGHQEADVTDFEMLRTRLAKVRPTLVFNTAAYTRVNDCERDAKTARMVNTTGAWNAMMAAQEFGAKLVYFSTDYVFPGRLLGEYAEDDAPEPLNTYGRTKLGGEKMTLEYRRGIVVRTSQVFAPVGRNFLRAVHEACRSKGEVAVVDDEFATPTYAPHLAEAVLKLAEVAESGIYHIRGPRELTYYDWARKFFELIRVPAHKLKRTLACELRLPAKRPQRVVLAMKKYAGLGLPPLPPLNEAMRDFVKKTKLSRED
jgi:dTDP-4-dehydrorhamnose reductase